MNIACIDCETTGLVPSEDYTIDTCIRDWNDAYCSLWRVRPGKEIPAEITAIHGITNEMVADAPSFGQVAGEIRGAIEKIDVIVGYNPDYDLNFLKVEFLRAGLTVKWPKVVVCAKRLWDIHLPQDKRHLQNAYKEFVNKDGFEGAHGAVIDTKATIEVMRAQIAMFNLANVPFAEMDPERRGWVGSSDHFIWKNDAVTFKFGKFEGKTAMEADPGYYQYILKNEFPIHVKEIAKQALTFLKLPMTEGNTALANWAKVNL